jgi:23S rRNA G2445 N2-methylase RlmL
VGQVRKRPGEDALIVDGTAQLASLEAARSVTAVWLRRTFQAPRPKALLGDEALRAAASDLTRVAGRHTFTGLRLEAAGRDSATLKRLAEAYAHAAGVVHDASGGDLVVRLRPARREGVWDLLIRTTPRPLSTRPWREVDLPGSLNACVAAAVWLHAGVQPGERILNPACGGGTLLAERLALGPAAFAAGFDTRGDALEAARTNLAGVAGGREVHLAAGDLHAPGWGLDPAYGPSDTIVCDPPWGDAVGDKQDADALHEALLSGAAAHLKPGGRLLLVTHAIKTTDRLLAQGGFTVVSDRRVFAGGHRPRLLHLTLTP